MNLLELASKQDQLSSLKRSADQMSSSSTSRSVTTPSSQRPKFEETKLAIFQVLAQKLHEIWKLNKDHPKRNNLEIEIRIGAVVLNNHRYKSQIHEKLAVVITDQHRQSYGSNLIFESGIDEIHASYLQQNALKGTEFDISVLVRIIVTNINYLYYFKISYTLFLFFYSILYNSQFKDFVSMATKIDMKWMRMATS